MHADVISVGSEGALRLYRNDQGKAFDDVSLDCGIVAPITASAVCVADVNGDGWLDVFITARGQQTLNGQPLNYQVGTHIRSLYAPACVCIINSRERLWEKHVKRLRQESLRVYRYFTPNGIELTLNPVYRAHQNTLFINNGAVGNGLKFSDDTTKAFTALVIQDRFYLGSTACAFADYDNDGDVDLFVVNGNYGIGFILLN